MREIIANLALFIVFSIAFSTIAGCGTASTPELSNVNVNSSNSSNAAADTGNASVYPKLAAGLANAELELLDGSTFKISDRKGKVLLLNIWGTWCGPCRAEMPHLVAMQERYGPQGFEVLGLNIGDGNGTPEDVDDIKVFAEKMKLNYTLARMPNSATAQFYQITKQQVVPQTLLVDRDGHLRGVFVGGGQRIIDSMNTELSKLMNPS